MTKARRMSTVATAGRPTSQAAPMPDRMASSVETRMDAAPNQLAVRDRATRIPGREREARKKSSSPFMRRRAANPTSRTTAT